MKFYIIGNMGSGKSTLGKSISQIKNIPYLDLDTIFWEEGFTAMRPFHLQDKELKKVQCQDCWVIEGVYKSLMRAVLKSKPHLVYLDIPWAENEQNMKKRGNDQQKIDYAKTYFDKIRKVKGNKIYNRDFHLKIFDEYEEDKTLLKNQAEIAAFVESLGI